MKRLRSKLTYANVMATIAVFLVLAGGTAFAASQMLPKNSVGSKQIKKAAVTPAKLSKAAKATLTGPQGATGPQGPKGEAGQAGKPGGDYFAMVDQTVEFIGEHPGFTSVSRVGTGAYCLGVQAGVNYYDPIASVEWLYPPNSPLWSSRSARKRSSRAGRASLRSIPTNSNLT